MKRIFLVCQLALIGSATAAVVQTIPGPPGMPMIQGSMVHINVTFTTTSNSTGGFSVVLDAPVPEMKPMSLWSPGNTFDPADPWYDELDPTQGAKQFSGRFGFVLDGASDAIPLGSSIGIRLLSSTTDLGTYFYRSTEGSELFAPVFLTSGAPHDYVLWNAAMWHPVFTMPATTPYGTTVQAAFEFFLADQVPVTGSVDYTTTANAVAGYSVGTTTLTWTAIPEPSTAGLALLGLGALSMFRRRPGRLLNF